MIGVADREQVSVVVRQGADHAVLDGAQILELVYQNGIPSCADDPGRVGLLQQLGRLDQEHVKVDHAPCGQERLVLDEECEVVVLEWVAAQPVCAETRQRIGMPSPRPFDAAEDIELVFRVGDTESGSEVHSGSELTEERGAKRVDRAALDPVRTVLKPRLEPLRDLSRRLVRERERADAGRVDAEAFDERAYALREAIRLARARAREHEERSGSGGDGIML